MCIVKDPQSSFFDFKYPIGPEMDSDEASVGHTYVIIAHTHTHKPSSHMHA